MCHHKQYRVHEIWTDLFVDRSMTGALDHSSGLFFIWLAAKKYRKEGQSRPVGIGTWPVHISGCRHKLWEMFTINEFRKVKLYWIQIFSFALKRQM